MAVTVTLACCRCGVEVARHFTNQGCFTEYSVGHQHHWVETCTRQSEAHCASLFYLHGCSTLAQPGKAAVSRGQASFPSLEHSRSASLAPKLQSRSKNVDVNLHLPKCRKRKPPGERKWTFERRTGKHEQGERNRSRSNQPSNDRSTTFRNYDGSIRYRVSNWNCQSPSTSHQAIR